MANTHWSIDYDLCVGGGGAVRGETVDQHSLEHDNDLCVWGGSYFENYHGQDECCIQILIQCYSVSSNRAFLPELQLRLSTSTTCTARKTSEGSEDLVHSKQPHDMKQFPQTSTENICIDSGSKQPQMLQNACRLLHFVLQYNL